MPHDFATRLVGSDPARGARGYRTSGASTARNSPIRTSSCTRIRRRAGSGRIGAADRPKRCGQRSPPTRRQSNGRAGPDERTEGETPAPAAAEPARRPNVCRGRRNQRQPQAARQAKSPDPAMPAAPAQPSRRRRRSRAKSRMPPSRRSPCSSAARRKRFSCGRIFRRCSMRRSRSSIRRSGSERTSSRRWNIWMITQASAGT